MDTPFTAVFNGKIALWSQGKSAYLSMASDGSFSATASTAGPNETFIDYTEMETTNVYFVGPNYCFLGPGNGWNGGPVAPGCSIVSAFSEADAPSFTSLGNMYLFEGLLLSMSLPPYDTGNTLMAVDTTGYYTNPPPDSEFTFTEIVPGFTEVYCGTKNWVNADLSYVNLSTIGSGLAGKDLTGANLQGANLSGLDLTQITISNNVNLQGANLSGANLVGMDLSQAQLQGADLSGAFLDGLDLSNATLNGVNFSGCDLTQVTFGTNPDFRTTAPNVTSFAQATLNLSLIGTTDWSNMDLTGATIIGLDNSVDLTGLVATNLQAAGRDFSGYTLSSANFAGAVLDQALFPGATARGTNFTGASLTGADLSNGIYAEASFDGCSAAGALFSNAILLNATFNYDAGAGLAVNLTGADFGDATLTGAQFTGGAMLVQSHFTGAILDSVDFTGAILGGETQAEAADLSYAYMPNVILDGTNLYGAVFAGVTLFGGSTSIVGTVTMEQATFVNAYLAEIDLTGAPLKGAHFDGACMVAVNLTNADLSQAKDGGISATLTGACLQGAILAGVNFSGADLSNVAIDSNAGSINVQYCNESGQVFPVPPEAMAYSAQAALSEGAFSDETTCPNGYTYQANVAAGRTWAEMLASANAPTSWAPKACAPNQTK